MQKRYTVMLGNALNALPPSVKVQVFHRGDSSWERGLHLNPGVERLKQTHGSRLAFHELPLRIRKAKRSDVLLSYDLWNTLDAEIVLAFGSGGAFCANALVHFEDFASFELIDGDGLLLTRKSAVLDVIRHKAGSSNCRCIEGKHGPTRYLASQLTSGGALDAPRKVKEHFAASSADGRRRVALRGRRHAARDGRGQAVRSHRAVPGGEGDLPSLHEPGCFGAPSSSDKDRCVAALCVSNPRPSGCSDPRAWFCSRLCSRGEPDCYDARSGAGGAPAEAGVFASASLPLGPKLALPSHACAAVRTHVSSASLSG